MNAAAVELLRTIVQQFAGARIILAGVIGRLRVVTHLAKH
jgi:hypothetical protein